jgi:hypothetical protein
MELVRLTVQSGAKVTSHLRQHFKHPVSGDFRVILYVSSADDRKGR